MVSPTIADLRHRAWILANKAIDTVNNINEVIYEGLTNKPARIENKPEDTTNIKLQYIQDGIDVYNSYLSEIGIKNDYFLMLQNKNKECMDDLSIISNPQLKGIKLK